MTQYRMLEKGRHAEAMPVGVAYQRNGDIWLFVPAWRGPRRLDVQSLDELSAQHYPSPQGPYHWSAVREYPGPMEHPIDVLRYEVSRPDPVPPGRVFVPTLDLIAQHLPDLIEILGHSILARFFAVRDLTWDDAEEVVSSGLHTCVGLPEEHALGQDSTEALQAEIQAEEAMARAIRGLVEAHMFPGHTSKIALALADALGPPDPERLDRAIVTLERLVLETDSLEARLLLAFCYRKRGGLDDAEEQLRKAVGLLRQTRGHGHA